MTWIFWAPALGEDDVELVLLLLDRGSGSAAAATGGGDGHRGGGGDAELLFERVEQLLELDDGQCGDRVEDLVLGE